MIETAFGWEPLPSAPAEMPEDLVVDCRTIAECWTYAGQRLIHFQNINLTPVQSGALSEWLPRAVAWQKGAE